MRIGSSVDRHAEQGNLVLGLIVVIGVAGLVATVFAYALFGQQSTRFDRAFQTSVTGAEAGLQQALTRITLGGDTIASPQSGSGTIGEVTYTWEATRLLSGPEAGNWEVWAEGRAELGQEVSVRRLESLIKKDSIFSLGAFADVAFVMRGENDALGYNSRTGATNNGLGSVGANGTVSMAGNAYSDYVYLFASAVCEKEGCNNPNTQVSNAGGDRFDIEGLIETIEEENNVCGTGDYEAWTASSGVALTGGSDPYCFSSMDFDVDVELVDASRDNPVVVYLSGPLDTANGVEVNCAGCTAASTPDSGALQIYSLGGSLTIGNGSAIAAAIAAPQAACQGSPSNAQALVFGSIICGDLTNQGGWDFFFDTALLDLSNAEYDLDVIREEIAANPSG